MFYTIGNMVAKIKEFVKAYHTEIALAVFIVCVTVISFNLGRASALQAPRVGEGSATVPLTGQKAQIFNAALVSAIPAPEHPANSYVVASKKSTSHLYHFPWCGGAKQISETNKITFATADAAKTAGYSLAGNCTP